MDEALVDIIFILLAGLVAVSITPKFDVEPPTSVEVEEGANALLPLQVAISADGALWSGSPAQVITVQQLYDMVAASDAAQTVEITADLAVPARLLIQANLVVQQAGRQAVMIVRSD